ncbi:MAG: hypothetical protein GF355_05080 [Candidatus Eisenbacteria bacterium]|nr:hypothetical protein [Candidatus Eisenbacteria bacterium]
MTSARKTDLAALGLINWRPMHGYALTRAYEELGLEHWTAISRSAIYAALRRLAGKGAVSIARERAGNAPERTVYHITDRGREFLHHILRDALSYVGPEDRYFYLGVAFAGALDAREILRRLDVRRERLGRAIEREQESLRETKRSAPGAAHLLAMMQAGRRHLEIEVDVCRELARILSEDPSYFDHLREMNHDQ